MKNTKIFEDLEKIKKYGGYLESKGMNKLEILPMIYKVFLENKLFDKAIKIIEKFKGLETDEIWIDDDDN